MEERAPPEEEPDGADADKYYSRARALADLQAQSGLVAEQLRRTIPHGVAFHNSDLTPDLRHVRRPPSCPTSPLPHSPCQALPDVAWNTQTASSCVPPRAVVLPPTISQLPVAITVFLSRHAC